MKCFTLWQDDEGQQSARDPVAKPDIGSLKAFMCACVGGNNCPDF